MNLFKFATVSLSVATVLLTVVSPVSATQTPEFTSCLTPTGSVVANYSDGTHGIVGLGSRIGQDKVYLLESGNTMQCFCGSDGSGIQTNWMKLGEISQDQIKVYESQGWIFVPSGSAWGLSDVPYLAKNISYACSSSTTNSGGGDGRTDGLSDGRSDGRGSLVQSARGNAANLASTGNLLFIAEIFAAGVILTTLGILLRKRIK